jgi:lactate dehydrogenase-like 2-hydroxyacid dehydrogenase
MSDQPLVLICYDLLTPLRGAIAAAGYEVVLSWEMPAERKPEVQAIVHAGEALLTPEFLLSLPNLRLIANVSAGFDGVDVPWCRAHGIEVTHSDGLNADDVADHALGLLVGGWRNIVAGDRTVRADAWNNHARLSPGPGLKGRRLGIMGLGHIGEAVAVRGEAFGMQVAWWGPNPKPAARWPRAESLLALARDSDILVIACRADAANTKAVSAQVIEAVGPQGMIVNVARGSILDEDALIAALKAGTLGRAGLDVFAQEPTPAARWADVPNVVLTPHSAGGTTNSLPLMVGQTLENLRRLFADEPMFSPVAA